MAIDRDLIQKKLAKLQASSNRNNSLWKPELGKNKFRIVPYQHQTDNPFLELYFGNGVFLCKSFLFLKISMFF